MPSPAFTRLSAAAQREGTEAGGGDEHPPGGRSAKGAPTLQPHTTHTTTHNRTHIHTHTHTHAHTHTHTHPPSLSDTHTHTPSNSSFFSKEFRTCVLGCHRSYHILTHEKTKPKSANLTVYRRKH